MQPTVGQVERELSHRIRALYNAQLGQRLSNVLCHFFDRELAITIENSVTQVEQTLFKYGYERLAEEVRLSLDQIISPQLKALVEEIIGNPIIDQMSHTNLRTGRTGIIIVLECLPDVRNPESIPKAKQKNLGVKDEGNS
jgi:uncharacterized protein YbcI